MFFSSSPNTSGLRDLQKKDTLSALLADAVAARNQLTNRPPLLVKIAPDLNDHDLEDIARVVVKEGIDGVIISNTTIQRPSTLINQGTKRLPNVHPLKR